jgi:hypothetical protein
MITWNAKDIATKELMDKGVIDGCKTINNIKKHEMGYTGKFSGSDNIIMGMDRALKLWRLGVEMVRRHRLTPDDFYNRVDNNIKYSVNQEFWHDIYAGIYHQLIISKDFPHTRDVIRLLVLPVIKYYKDSWNVSSYINTLYRLRKESVAVQYMDRDSSKAVMIGLDSNHKIGVPTPELMTMEPKDRLKIYSRNTILRFNDTISGLLFKSIIALNRCENDIDRLDLFTRDASLFRSLFVPDLIEIEEETPKSIKNVRTQTISLAELLFNNGMSISTEIE